MAAIDKTGAASLIRDFQRVTVEGQDPYREDGGVVSRRATEYTKARPDDAHDAHVEKALDHAQGRMDQREKERQAFTDRREVERRQRRQDIATLETIKGLLDHQVRSERAGWTENDHFESDFQRDDALDEWAQGDGDNGGDGLPSKDPVIRKAVRSTEAIVMAAAVHRTVRDLSMGRHLSPYNPVTHMRRSDLKAIASLIKPEMALGTMRAAYKEAVDRMDTREKDRSQSAAPQPQKKRSRDNDYGL